MKICPTCDGECSLEIEMPWPTNNSVAEEPKYTATSCFTCDGLGEVDDDVMAGDTTGCNNDPDMRAGPDNMRDREEDR